MLFKPKFLSGFLVIFTDCKLAPEILGFLNYMLIDDLNVYLDSQYTRILDSLSKLISGLIPPPRGFHKNTSKTNEK